MAWRRRREDGRFPAPLREFREQEWPPVPGECLEHYGCQGEGYGRPCVPRPGEFCGQLHYEMLARDHPEKLAAAKASDAYVRFNQARLSWLGEDDPGWMEEWLAGQGEADAIRYGRRPHGVA